MKLNKLGGISGFLKILSGDGTINFPLQGCYDNQDGLLKFTFSVDWSVPEEENWGFTCFAGHFVNNDILIVDWIVVKNRSSDNLGITGSDFLISSSVKANEREKLFQRVRPFPVEVGLS
jgi:hypothetical protein